MSLPINRSAKATLDANLVNGITSDAPAVKASEDIVYNTIDELYNYALSLVTSGTLSPLPPNNVQYQSLFNGGFVVNQRVVSGTVVLSAGQYGHDRWKAGAAGCTYTFSTTNNVTTINITSGSLIQVIEGSNLYDGTYALSWTGTAQGKIGAGIYGSSGITGTVVGGTNLSIEFNVGTLSKAQFNKGSTPFPYQPRSFAEELQLCQRYYEKSGNYTDGVGLGNISLAAAQVANNKTSSTILYKVRKRVSPTVTIYDTAGAPAKASWVQHGVTTVNLATGVTDGNEYGFGLTSTATDSTAINLAIVRFAADAEL